MKCRAVLGLALAPVVQAGSGYVGMAEPFLDLGNVTLVIERVRRCRGTHQGGQYRPVPYTLQRIRGGGLQQPAGLGITERGRAAILLRTS